MLQQANQLQIKYGYGEEESEAFVHRLPKELRLEIDAEVPPRKVCRFTTPTCDRVSRTAKTQNYHRQTLFNIVDSCQDVLTEVRVGEKDDAGRTSGSVIEFGAPDSHPQKSERKGKKSREWERRQQGLKADVLRINNSARASKSQKRRKLRSTPGWESLSLEEQASREFHAFGEIERRRQEKIEAARGKWQS